MMDEREFEFKDSIRDFFMVDWGLVAEHWTYLKLDMPCKRPIFWLVALIDSYGIDDRLSFTTTSSRPPSKNSFLHQGDDIRKFFDKYQETWAYLPPPAG
jgi:hypothetical protein